MGNRRLLVQDHDLLVVTENGRLAGVAGHMQTIEPHIDFLENGVELDAGDRGLLDRVRDRLRRARRSE